MRPLVRTPPLVADSVLPQRDVVVDEDAVGRWLAEHLGVGGPLAIGSCVREWASYVTGQRVRALLRVDVAGESHWVAQRTFKSAKRCERAYLEALARAVPCGPLRPVVGDAAHDTLFYTFPNDRKLAGLPALRGEPPSGLLAGWSASRVVAYRPERAATAQCLNESGEVVAFAKVHADPAAASAAQLWRSLAQALPAEDPHLRLPRVLGWSERHKMVLLEPMPGLAVGASRSSKAPARFGALGAGLARLHALEVDTAEAPRFERSRSARLARAADLIGRARPDVAALAAELARVLSSCSDATSEPAVCVHGDAKSANALVHDGRVALIDPEAVSLGPAAADVGKVLAGLRYRLGIGELSPSAERELHDAVVAGYGRVRDLPDAASLRWHTSAALFAHYGLRAVKSLSPEALPHLPALLADARAMLARPGWP